MMNHSQARHRFAWKRAVVIFLLVLAAASIMLVTVASIAFYGQRPTVLACRGCAGDARAVSVNGFDLYYREVGAGSARPPVVLVHGGPGHSSQSFKQSFDFLASRYRVIYYDQRGSGSSQIKPDSSLYTVDQLVEELEALRRDVIGADKIIVIGHSAGGALAQRYAIKYPQHVDRLALVSSIQVNNGVSAPLLFDRFLPVLFLFNGAMPRDPGARDQWFAQLNETQSATRLYDPAKAALVQKAGYLSFATWREVSRSLEGKDYAGELRQMRIPTLVAYGAADSSYTGEDMAKKICGILPDCTLAGFEKSGHWPFLEEPERFQVVLWDFLGK